KKNLILMALLIFSITLPAQKNIVHKGTDKPKNETSASREDNEQIEKEEKIKGEHNDKIWEGTYGYGGNVPKLSINQPARVRAAFQKDYPNAINASWSKYRGNWTTTFRNGSFMSTALYHANGERRDTRTLVTKNEIPRNVLDSIFNRRRDTWLEDIIKIEVPGTINDIFRIKDIVQEKTQYFYYNSEGKLVRYNY